ncbi:hypothetical protein NIES4073_57760 [Kalymmatonema gypsitolerans NIES-4073]|nr:hypothetical protein NIES4073_57760 [Scytonema sp. NIES-4073]
MFWKFIVSALLLPSCLGFEIAAASLQKGVQTQPEAEELKAQVAQIGDDPSIQTDWEADTEQLKHHKHHHYHKPRRRYSRPHRPCPQSYRQHYRRGSYHPQYIHYRRGHGNHHRYYRHGQNHPDYIYDRDLYRNPYRYHRHGRYYH